MNNKSLLCIVLSFMLTVSILSGCGAKPDRGETQSADYADASVSRSVNDTIQDEELLRAIQYGIVTEDFLSEADKVVTYKEFCSMLTEIVRLRDENLVSQWENLAVNALQSDETMQRDDAVLAIFEAALVMGIDNEMVIGIQWQDQSDLDDWWEGQTRDYNLFPDWEEPYGEDGYDHYMNGAWYLEGAFSSVSGKNPFEPDEHMTYGFDRDVTRSEAAIALTRYAESNARILEPDAVYIATSDVGEYDRSIITDEIIAGAPELPDVTQEKLPSQWKGTGLSGCKDGVQTYRDFQESDIAFLAQNGFNFTRLAFGFDTLRFPDNPADPYLVNENELKDLDQLLAWCIEYGVHLQIAMSWYMDASGCYGGDIMPQTQEEWALTQAYWEMLARRYKGISSRYLSFDLSNEIQPNQWDGEIPDSAKAGFAAEVSAVKAADPDRVLLHGFMGNPNMEWVEYTASLGVALGCHPYLPQAMCSGDYPESLFLESNLYWPRPFFNSILVGGEEVTISGEGLHGELSVYINNSDTDVTLTFYADGTEFASQSLSGELNEYGGYDLHDNPITAGIPEGTQTVSIRLSQNGAALSAVGIENSDFHTYLMCHNAYEGEQEYISSHLCIDEDGVWGNTDEKIVDAQTAYEKKILPMKDIADANGVGFMVNEFGLFSVSVDWDIDFVCAYHEDFLQMLTEKEIGWAYCELYNVLPKHIVILYGDSQWSGATTETVTVEYGDGKTAEKRVCMELLDTITRFTR